MASGGRGIRFKVTRRAFIFATLGLFRFFTTSMFYIVYLKRKTQQEKQTTQKTQGYLGSGLPGCLCLCSHGSLQLHGQLHVLNLHALHLYPPVISGIIQGTLLGRQKAGWKCSVLAQEPKAAVFTGIWSGWGAGGGLQTESLMSACRLKWEAELLGSFLDSATNKLMWVGKHFLKELNFFCCC